MIIECVGGRAHKHLFTGLSCLTSAELPTQTKIPHLCSQNKESEAIKIEDNSFCIFFFFFLDLGDETQKENVFSSCNDDRSWRRSHRFAEFTHFSRI